SCPAMTEAESPAAKIAWFSEQEEIPFEKRTKKGTKTVNMKDFVKDIRWDDQRRACLVTLVSGNQGSLNPNALTGVLFPDCKVRIRRMFLSDETGVGLY
ncbi:MAG: DUF2344 domain-containing protein, partial [Bacillota bacterium]|nr:DUF2344 domain-containing protein [Bacillota bacterium]